MKYSIFVRGVIAGIAGGLAGTISMSLFGAGIFTFLGWPTDTSFSIIGDSAAAFFSNLGIALAGSAQLGKFLYYLIGLIMGVIFGVTACNLEALRLCSTRKMVGLSILYVEAMSLPLLAASTMALKLNAGSAGLWFGISFVMHLVHGLVLGLVLRYGMGGARWDGSLRSPGIYIVL